MIKLADNSDCAILAELAAKLWSGHSEMELEQEFVELTSDPEAACFIKYIGEKPVGFAQCQLRRDYVEGTSTSPVGYLEGIFILDEYRHQGYAKELLSCCEKWAWEKNCTEFASDCEIYNDVSLHFHLAMGFEEAGRIICFKKALKSIDKETLL
jgi:Acetyltransferases